MSSQDISEEDRQTLFVFGLSKEVDEEILYELFLNVSFSCVNSTLCPQPNMILQAGPLYKVNIPIDHNTKQQKNFGFVRFQHEESVKYAIELLRGTKLFGQTLSMQNRKTGAGMQSNRQNDNNRPQTHRSNSMPSHHQHPQYNQQQVPFQQQQHYQQQYGQNVFQPPFNQQVRGYNDQQSDRRDQYEQLYERRDHHDRRDYQNDRSRRHVNYPTEEHRRHHSYDRDDRSQHHRDHEYRDRSRDFRDRSHDRRHYDDRQQQQNRHRRY